MTKHLNSRSLAPLVALLAGAALAIPAGAAATEVAPVTKAEKPSVRPSAKVVKPTVDSSTSTGRNGRAVAAPGWSRMTATCNHYYHWMNVTGKVWFNTNRFPNGSWVYLRYAYARVNASGAQITPTYVGNWLNAGFVRPNVHTEPGAPNMPAITSVDWNTLDTRNLPVGSWGQWVAWTQATIYNGQAWENTAWASPPEGYFGANRFGSGGYDSACRVSLTG